jgi:hypothetical protein
MFPEKPANIAGGLPKKALPSITPTRKIDRFEQIECQVYNINNLKCPHSYPHSCPYLL